MAARTTAPRVHLVTETRLYREALVAVLEADPAVAITGASDLADEWEPVVGAAHPDVVLVDAPPSAARRVVARVTAAAPRAHVIALAIRETEQDVLAWAEAGVAGYVTHATPLSEVTRSIAAVMRGEVACSPGVAGALLRHVAALAAHRGTAEDRHLLTPREREVVDLLEQRLSNREIARRLGISVATVKNHVHNLLEKLEVHSRADALARLGRAPRSL